MTVIRLLRKGPVLGKPTRIEVVVEIDHGGFGVHAEGGGDEFGSMVLTKSSSRVQRITRGGKPQASRTWLT
jgi:hypothetical protein